MERAKHGKTKIHMILNIHFEFHSLINFSDPGKHEEKDQQSNVLLSLKIKYSILSHGGGYLLFGPDWYGQQKNQFQVRFFVRNCFCLRVEALSIGEKVFEFRPSIAIL